MLDPKNIDSKKTVRHESSDQQKTRPTAPPKSDKDFKGLVNDKKESKSNPEAGHEQPKTVFEMVSRDNKEKSTPNINNRGLAYKDSSLERPSSRFSSSTNRSTGRQEKVKERDNQNQPTRKNDVEESDSSHDNEEVSGEEGPEEKIVTQAKAIKPGIIETTQAEPEIIEKDEIPEKKSVVKGKSSDQSSKSGHTSNTLMARADIVQEIAGVPTNSAQVGAQIQQNSTPQAQLANTIQVLVAEIVSIQSKGQTDTVVILNNPPILKDATIKLTSFESAKNEFNITFANLSPQAKQFLDAKLLQTSLIDQLRMEKDIVVHQLITTTQPDQSLPQNKPDQPKQGRDEEGGGGGRGREGGQEEGGQGDQNQRQRR